MVLVNAFLDDTDNAVSSLGRTQPWCEQLAKNTLPRGWSGRAKPHPAAPLVPVTAGPSQKRGCPPGGTGLLPLPSSPGAWANPAQNQSCLGSSLLLGEMWFLGIQMLKLYVLHWANGGTRANWTASLVYIHTWLNTYTFFSPPLPNTS